MDNAVKRIDIRNIPYDDQETWKLIQNGINCGVFQMESDLFHHWMKKVKPTNIWELSILVALLRPGCLGSGEAENYLKYRNNPLEIPTLGNKIADEIVSSTGHVPVFQEQLMNLGKKLAWCHLPDNECGVLVDNLRKAVGKKDQKKILEIGKKFVDGCLHNNVSEELANKLFEIIKKSGRYAFNASHAVIYAHVAYKTAYLKTHFPDVFFMVYLNYAEEKIDKWNEIKKIVNEAKQFGINVITPNINTKNINFKISGNNIIYGLRHMRHGLSGDLLKNIHNIPPIVCLKDFIRFSFDKTFCGFKPRSNTLESLILSNAFRDTKEYRENLYNLYSFLKELTDKEIEKLVKILPDTVNCFNIKDHLSIDLICNKKRSEKVKSYLHFLNMSSVDNPSYIAKYEKEILGCILTCASVDGKKISDVNFCEELLNVESIKLYEEFKLAVNIDQVFITTTKKGKNPGQNMARINVYDSSAHIKNLPVFPEQYQEYSDTLIENNTVLLTIIKQKSGLVIKQIEQI